MFYISCHLYVSFSLLILHVVYFLGRGEKFHSCLTRCGISCKCLPRVGFYGFLWCSGCHVRLTRERSPVRNWAETVLNCFPFVWKILYFIQKAKGKEYFSFIFQMGSSFHSVAIITCKNSFQFATTRNQIVKVFVFVVNNPIADGKDKIIFTCICVSVVQWLSRLPHMRKVPSSKPGGNIFFVCCHLPGILSVSFLLESPLFFSLRTHSLCYCSLQRQLNQFWITMKNTLPFEYFLYYISFVRLIQCVNATYCLFLRISEKCYANSGLFSVGLLHAPINPRLQPNI